MQNPAWSSVIKLTQTISPSLLNETAFLYSGNKITLTPVAGSGGSFVQPSGWTATSFFPVANNVGSRMPRSICGHAAEYNLELELLPVEERL